LAQSLSDKKNLTAQSDVCAHITLQTAMWKITCRNFLLQHIKFCLLRWSGYFI